MQFLKNSLIRRILFVFLLMVFMTGGRGMVSGGVGEPEVLARVEVDNLVEDLAQLGLPVYAHLIDGKDRDYALVKASSSQLKRAGVRCQTLDKNTKGKEYFILSILPQPGPVPEKGLKHVLHNDGVHVIVRSTFKQVETYIKDGYDVRWLGNRPMVLGKSRDFLQPQIMPLAYDSTVQQMIDQVTQTKVYDYSGNITGENSVNIGGSPYTITTRNTNSGTAIENATQYVYEFMQGLGLNVSYFNWTRSGYSGRNVIGEKTGITQPGEIVLVTAHYDCMPSSGGAPGADDNGSGSVGVMVCAEILSQYQFNRTLRFVFYTGEEQGILGSYEYAGQSYANGENIVAVYNMDMMGYDGSGDPYLRLHTRTSSSSGYTGDLAIANTFVDVVNDYGLSAQLSPIVDSDGMGQSDHVPFWNNGYPAILSIEDHDNDITPYYHTSSDTRATLNMTYFTSFVKASVGTAAHLAIYYNGTPQPPVANFSGAPTSIIVGQTVSFTDLSTNAPTSWSWDFGDSGTSTLQNPGHTYNTLGTYSVSLTATNANGSDTETKTGYIQVVESSYCEASSTNQNYEWIAGVAVGDLDNASSASPYSDFTGLTATLSPGSSVSVSLTPGFAGSSYTEYWKIWIDYNGDRDFEDAGEEVFSGSGSSVVSGNFTVNATASGTTRMRVSMNYNAAPPICGSWTYGECEDYSVTFGQVQQYTLTTNTAGQGSVTLDPEGGAYNEGAVVTVTATPVAGWQFDGWSGDLNGSTNPATITMNSNKTVTANFSEVTVQQYTLTVNVVGQGAVDLNPPGGVYDSGSEVDLTATADSGWQFSGWSGDLNGSTNPAAITMNSAKTVTATFTETGTTAEVGETDILGSSTTTANRRAMPFTMPENGSISSISMYHEGGSGDMILGIYDGEGAPANRIGVTASTAVSASAGWQTINLTAPVQVQGGGTIWLAWVYESNPGIRYSSGSPGRYDAGVGWSGGMPTSFGGGSQANYLYSIYATYTPTGGPSYANVGNTTIYGSTSTSANRRAHPFSMPETGTIESITMYHSGGSGDMILAVYDGEGAPANRIAVTATTAVSGATGWQTIDLQTPVQVQGGSTIWLAWVYESNPGIAYQTGSPGRYQSSDTWSGGMPVTFGSGSQASYVYSIYATYSK